ncbi:MAG: HEAT repeat domain-containing protein, partial [Candidatus Omnitrophica bacterium]|nr:HEAT repeat domain-containing protein [Candidatus Omnitrophota bacterium]
PDLWALRDKDGDGQSDERTLLSSGYGVHISLLGHDSHGLRKGPDGRIYFSIGDRGFNIKSEDDSLVYPHRGAVLRCEPDGSNLEVVHSGLRNPQELAFDNYGNLFTGDNNSDAGDQARWVYVVPGGESGWLIYHQWSQYPETRGIWMSEKIWYLEEEGQAAYFLPPLAHIASGPSGLAYYDGTGLPKKYENTFFLCDFRGTPTSSKIHAIQLKNKGAAFEVDQRWDFVTGNLPTDVDFGVRNGIYFSDWVDGWDQPLKGRIYRVYDPTREEDPVVLKTEKILNEGFADRSKEDLLGLLGHPNQRVRLESQWALADLKDDAVPDLIATAKKNDNLLARFHAIWGLGQIGRTGDLDPAPIIDLLSDPEMEIRAQAARVLGWIGDVEGVDALIQSLKDDSLRVRFLSAISLGEIDDPKAVEPLLEMIAENDNRDRYLRHGGVMGLVGCSEEFRLAALTNHDSPAVRLAAVLALRKLESENVAGFLGDPDFFIAAEAARAINDTGIDKAMPELAAAIDRLPKEDSFSYEPLVRRAINANYRLGGVENAEALAKFALSDEDPERRAEALMRLGEWGDPDNQDKVTGIWRPLPDRDPEIAKRAIVDRIEELLSDPKVEPRVEGMKLIAIYDLGGHEETLFEIAKDENADRDTRIEAVATLVSIHSGKAGEAIESARSSKDTKLRSAATAQLGRLDPEQAVGIFAEVLETGSIEERQSVFASLEEIHTAEAKKLILAWLQKLHDEEVPKEIQLDILFAAAADDDPDIQAKCDECEALLNKDDSIHRYRPALFGGDADRGKKVFFENASTSCTRCHALNGEGGGEVGPDLSHIASRVDREYILESIVAPNAQIAKGFENVTLTLKDGTRLAGRVTEENGDTLTLEVTSEGEDGFDDEWDEDAFLESLEKKKEEAIPHSTVDVVAEDETPNVLETRTIPKSEIESRKRNLSAMPEDMARLMGSKEIRD